MRARRLIWILVSGLSLIPAVSLAQETGQKKVLVVYSTRRDTQLPTMADREIPKLLQQGLSAAPDFYSEHIDAARFPEAPYQAAFREYLRLKYLGKHFDVVMAMNRNAYEMVSSVRTELFPGTPVVYITQDRAARRIANAAGTTIELDHRRTIALATRLQPDTEEVFVVSGSSPRDAAVLDVARGQFSTLGPGLTFTYLSGLATDDLERRLGSLPEHAIVYYLILYQDADGVNVNPLDYLSRLTALSNRPVYSWVDSTMDHGVVGGSLMALEQQVRVLTALALRVLRGEAADAIGASSVNLQVDQVDWRQLRRWHIDEARLPAGTLVRFREPSRWERDKSYILFGLVVVLAETALIAGLIVQLVRRRRAEAKERDAAAALRASYDRIRDLGGRLLGAQEAERSRIARELHDDISQQLSVLAINLDILSNARPDRADEALKLAREAHARVLELADSVHQLSHQLHPARLRVVGLAAALGALQREAQAAGHSVTFRHENVPAVIPQDVMLCVYRIAQEAVQNAIKHSGAREIAMSLTGKEDTLTLTVVDDGAGFDVGSSMARGLGLISMGERLEPFGGTLHIDSTPGRGTRVEARVVVPMAQASHAESA